MTQQRAYSKTTLRTGKNRFRQRVDQDKVQDLDTTNPNRSSEIEALLFAPEKVAPVKEPED